MANIYIDAMVDIIRNVNPDFDQSTAESLAWSGLQETWAYELMKMASLEDEAGKNIWERRIIERNEAERNSTKDAKGTNCSN